MLLNKVEELANHNTSLNLLLNLNTSVAQTNVNELNIFTVFGHHFTLMLLSYAAN